MHGNVWEWVGDCHEDYDRVQGKADGRAHRLSGQRCKRAGSFRSCGFRRVRSRMSRHDLASSTGKSQDRHQCGGLLAGFFLVGTFCGNCGRNSSQGLNASPFAGGPCDHDAGRTGVRWMLLLRPLVSGPGLWLKWHRHLKRYTFRSKLSIQNAGYKPFSLPASPSTA